MTQYGFIKVAAAIPPVNVADVESNVTAIVRMAIEASEKGARIIAFPELCISAYTCADLFGQTLLLDQIEKGIADIMDSSSSIPNTYIIIGAALRYKNSLYNCAVVIKNSQVLGVVPKTYLPNYSEFYEQRWFASGANIRDERITICGNIVPFSTNLLFDTDEATFAVEICEDLWTPIPPSSYAALAGANVIVNLSATDEVIGKHKYLQSLISQQSARTRTAYIYSSCGYGESSTDLVFAGNAIIYENGSMLANSERFNIKEQIVYADVDIERLENDRRHTNTFSDSNGVGDFKTIRSIDHIEYESGVFNRFVDPHPFIPNNNTILTERCEEIINIQTAGLMRRLDFTRTKNLVVGISGGLDSTLALLVAVKAFDKLGLSRTGIHGITMPGFGTTDRTYTNALNLMKQLGITIKEISIAPAVTQHFQDIGHDMDNHDVTYENCQARERTQILMDYANKVWGMVLGTGDLSELALGWATYNGDHMSMYGVNAGVPKTLVKHLVRWFAISSEDGELKHTLLDIVDTPISPELIPADEAGNIKQKTEDLVGPYELHDFFLYYCMRYGFAPDKVFFLAKQAFAGAYDDDTIKKWLQNFYRRFFAQQFKRSCLPDGPKVGSVTLSPRGDWRMPSDATSKLWLNICEQL